MFTVVVGRCWFLVVCGCWLNVFTYKLRFKLKSCDEGWTSWWLAAGGSKCVVTQWSRREPKGSDFWMHQANIRHMSNMSLLVAMSSVSFWHSWVHLKNTSSQILQVLLPQNICYFQWCDLTIWWGLSWYTCAMFIYIYLKIYTCIHIMMAIRWSFAFFREHCCFANKVRQPWAEEPTGIWNLAMTSAFTVSSKS